MQVRIQSKRADGGATFVVAETSLGVVMGRWHGADPIVGERYGVELDIGDELVWGVTLRASSTAPSIVSSAASSTIVATLVRIDDDVVVVAIADGITLLEASGGAPDLAPGAHVRFEARDITIYDART